MAYQSLYRKYRPQTFADVVGQGHVTRTLQNALASGRVAHGYLFTGTRGTAKTTVARLLAKALNCESSDHPVPEPCNVCPACIAITGGSSIDVIEMDAASHRGVADIEEVRKSVGYGPMELRYKVFIIDEAHQLSADAKDAFLKTLEEPPDNVVFILATTEPQAIPITIRSRCQQFDFKRGSLADITARLRYVLECEGVTFEPAAVGLIARGAEGSYRDSLSLLEQVLAFAPTHVSAHDVETVLGALDTEMLARVTQAVAARDAAGLFALAGELLDSGKEARTLLRTLSLHFRDLLLVSVGGPAVAQELTPDEVGRLQAEARSFTPPQMLRAMEILNEAQGETRWNNQHRLLVELTFLKLTALDGKTDGAAAPVTFTSAPIVFGTPTQTPANQPPPVTPVAARPTPAAPTITPVSPIATPAVTPTAAPPPAQVAPPAPATPVATAEVNEDDSSDEANPYPTPGFYAAEETDDEDDFVPEDPSGSLFPVEETPLADAPAVGFSVSADEDEEKEPIDTSPGLFEDDPAAAPIVPPTAPPSVVAATTSPTPPTAAAAATPDPSEGIFLTLDDLYQAWPNFLRKAGGVSKKTEMMMLRAQPTNAVRDTVEITFQERANFEMMSQPKSHAFVRDVLKRCLGVRNLVVHFRLDESAAPPPPRPTGGNRGKTERDPLRQLDEMEANGAGDETEPYGNGSGGNGNGRGYGEEPPPPSSAYSAPQRSEPQPTPQAFRPQEPPAAAAGGFEAPPAAVNDNARRAAALENPLVQEALSVFGGEIVDE